MNPENNSQPAQSQPAPSPQPQMVYITRPLEPMQPIMTEEVKRKHEESTKQFPFLNLSEGEYVISAVKRHPIGLLQIWAIVGFFILLLFGILGVFATGYFKNTDGRDLVPTNMVAIPVLLLTTVTLLFGLIEASIYSANKFFLTNESVIQYVQTGLFTKRQQTVSLSNIEDASYSQNGIIPSMFNYGQIRLSTQGDETTYRFAYASQPEKQVAVLNNAVEAFKNGRPVMHH